MDPESALTEFERLEDLIQTDLDFPSRDHAVFYEFGSRLIAESKVSPIQVWSQRFAETDLMNHISETLGSRVAPWGLQVASQGVDPNSHEWTQIHIHPFVDSAETSQVIDAVVRSKDRESVMQFVRDFEVTVDNLLSITEDSQR